jgi:5-(carboxyamino)imidazole ribonucleotide mutase
VTTVGNMSAPKVAVVMGSDSDWPVMKDAVEVLESAGVDVFRDIVSAHRTPEKMMAFSRAAREHGFSVVIAGAGGAAHLPGMIASSTTLPVIGVPIPLKQLEGMDSLLSIVQMPSGIPVATVGIGQAKNAGLLAIRMLSTSFSELRDWIDSFQADQSQSVLNKKLDA